MKLQHATLVYFSPTGSTRKIAMEICKAMQIPGVSHLDLTTALSRRTPVSITTDLVIIGAPVYEEVLPTEFVSAFQYITFNCSVAVGFSVYGNISFGRSLKQLHALLEQKGLQVLALGTFIGRHSFSTKQTPLAEGRPDAQDILQIETFAQCILARMHGAQTPLNTSLIPSSIPFFAHLMPKNSARWLTKPPVMINSGTAGTAGTACTACGACVRHCPMQAIRPVPDLSIDTSLCIRCFACVRICPAQARRIDFNLPWLVSVVFKKSNRIRKKPFLW
jgi:ferredoxin